MTNNINERIDSYICDNCGQELSQKEVYDILNTNKNIPYLNLGITEKEFFKACHCFNFKPYYIHSFDKINRRYDWIKLRIDSEIKVYTNIGANDQTTLDNAYKYFDRNKEDIQNYYNTYSLDEIKTRYEFYCIYNQLLNEIVIEPYNIFDKIDLDIESYPYNNTYEIDDFEEPYFLSCYYMGLKPNVKYRKNQIEKIYDKLMESMEDENIFPNIDIYDCDIVDTANYFLEDNNEEIKKYLSKYSAEEIEDRYNYYLNSISKKSLY